jgi:large subunit ribosomal protein L24
MVVKKTKSKKPRKQRKFLYNAPLHVRRKLMSAHLSKELRKQYKKRTFPVRKGDEVEIMRGEFAGKRGKVSKVDYKNYKVYVEGITRKRTTGTDVQVPFHPSKLKIINLNLEDELRRKALLRGSKLRSGESSKGE